VFEEAMKENPRILATACPFCFLMFQEAIQITDKGDKIRLMDIAEIVDRYVY